jgi:hypothetical protein
MVDNSFQVAHINMIVGSCTQDGKSIRSLLTIANAKVQGVVAIAIDELQEARS